MTPKEKAKELVEKYHIKVEVTFTEHSIPSIINAQMLLISAKKCALIAANEIIQTLNWDIRDLDVRGSVLLDLITYWRNVETEIERL